MVISAPGMRNGTMAAVLHTVFEDGEISSAIIERIQRTKTEQAIDLFKFMAGVVFAFSVGKPPVAVFVHPVSHVLSVSLAWLRELIIPNFKLLIHACTPL